VRHYFVLTESYSVSAAGSDDDDSGVNWNTFFFDFWPAFLCFFLWPFTAALPVYNPASNTNT